MKKKDNVKAEQKNLDGDEDEENIIVKWQEEEQNKEKED